MAADPKRRQKQLQRKAAKRKERHRQLVKQKNRGLTEKIADAAARAPVLHSFISETAWSEGLGQVLISRALPDQHVAFSLFLVDRFCLGVKDAFSRIVVKAEYHNSFLPDLKGHMDLIAVTPETARRFVEDAVEYARGLGLSPHPDYQRARAIFGDLDSDAADEAFEFGKDGKPFFVAGPFDTPDRCRRICSTLEHSCGINGFHFMTPVLDLDSLPPQLGSRGPLLLGRGDGFGEYDDDEDADDVDEAEDGEDADARDDE